MPRGTSREASQAPTALWRTLMDDHDRREQSPITPLQRWAISHDEALDRRSLWRDRAGRSVAIKNMTDDHLISCARMIRDRDHQWRQEFFKPIMKEARNRGIEGAVYLDYDGFHVWREEKVAERAQVIDEPEPIGKPLCAGEV